MGNAPQQEERDQREHTDAENDTDRAILGRPLGKYGEHVALRHQGQGRQGHDGTQEVGHEGGAIELLGEQGVAMGGAFHGLSPACLGSRRQR
jgi:hypothetical protein